jgi:hypothetical protein
MTEILPRPVFQRQGPGTNCKIAGKNLGWESCTAYSMAMGIDAYTGGRIRPTGCKIREGTGDLIGGLTLRQVADVAQARYGIRVAVRSGGTTIAPNKAARLIRAGRGFVLQGNAAVLLGTPSQSTGGPVNHAIWVQAVRGGTDDVPDQVLVYDPAADGRRGLAKGPQWWPWSRLVAYAADLRMDDAGVRRLGPGRFYAGFLPPRPDAEAEDSHHPTPAPAPAPPRPPAEPPVKLAKNGQKTDPCPVRLRAAPPPGRRVNVRRRTDLSKESIVDLLAKGDLFIAYQTTTRGMQPPGAVSRAWYGNRDGTEWVHNSGVRREGPRGVALDDPDAEPPTDIVEDEDTVPGSDDLPDDIREDDLTPHEPVEAALPVPETDVDAPVAGQPDEGEIPQA